MENEVEEELSPCDETEAYQAGGGSKVARAVNFIQNKVCLALDTQHRPVAIYKDGNYFAKDIQGKSFIRDIRKNGFQHGDFLKTEEIKEVLAMLGAIAEFGEGELVHISKRVAKIANGIEIDTGDKQHTILRIENGEILQVTDGSEVTFERTDCMLPYPGLVESGDIELLKKYVRLKDKDFYLLIGWLSYTLSTPRSKYAGYCLLIVIGTMGSGKSFFCKEIIRSFVDPVSNPIALLPKTPKDLAIASQKSHLQVIDNLRELSREWSDVMCSFATSGTISERALYTNSEEHTIQVHAPLVLNGIHHFLKESDLASRTLTFHLKPMPETLRKEEKAIVKELEADKPAIFTGILQLIAQVLLIIDDVEVKHASRIIGFVKFLAGMEKVLGFEAGELQLAYEKNIKNSMLETLIEDAFSHAVLAFAVKHKEPNLWTGTPAQLLSELSEGQNKRVLNSQKLWPQNPIAQTKRLKILEKTLNSQGVVMVLGERGKLRKITIGLKTPLEKN